MPSLKVIRNRISSVKSTQKITKAMKMVAGARLARAQSRMLEFRPFSIKTADVLGHITTKARQEAVALAQASDNAEGVVLHPLLERRPEKKALYLVLTSDRGLCGAFNANVQRAALRERTAKDGAGTEVVFATIGKRGRDFLRLRGAEVVRHFTGVYEATGGFTESFAKAQEVSQWVTTRFLKGEIDAFYIVYNEFKSAITQTTTVEQILPLKDPPADAPAEDFIFEPGQDKVLEAVVPLYLAIQIYRSIIESVASEHGARMSAMDSATRNATKLVQRLTLQYNRARQAAITKELMEIIGGAEALKD
jgi:F-type H+-transporting ATPase subunit gamma